MCGSNSSHICPMHVLVRTSQNTKKIMHKDHGHCHESSKQTSHSPHLSIDDLPIH
jgi:hypothetical protein